MFSRLFLNKVGFTLLPSEIPAHPHIFSVCGKTFVACVCQHVCSADGFKILANI